MFILLNNRRITHCLVQRVCALPQRHTQLIHNVLYGPLGDSGEHFIHFAAAKNENINLLSCNSLLAIAKFYIREMLEKMWIKKFGGRSWLNAQFIRCHETFKFSLELFEILWKKKFNIWIGV